MNNNKTANQNKSGGWSVASLEACLSDCLAQVQAVKSSAHPFAAEMAAGLEVQIQTVKALILSKTQN